MAARLQMPQLGATMTEGRLVKWLVAEGQPVRKGQSVAEIETDKIVAEVEAPTDGVLASIVAQPDEVVEVTGLLGWIAAAGEEMPPAEERERPVQLAPRHAAVKPSAARVTPPATGERIPASPRARRLAGELGVDLRQVRGSGTAGRITGRDVEAYAEGRTLKPPPLAAEITVQEVVPVVGVRRLVAQRMAESAQTTASVTLFAQADATALVRLRADLRGILQSPLGYDEFLIKITAHALHEFPYMNARLKDEGTETPGEINVGFALDTERGLLVPVIRDADDKNLRSVAREVRELIERGRSGILSPDDLAGGTFTITNLGMYGVECFTPLINLPQCAILGIGHIAPRPAVVNGELAVREMVCLSLSFDHRLVDGAPAARFLQRVVQLIQEPCLLLV